LTSAGLGDPHAARWGREWIMLPNPMYGLWEEAAGQAGYWPRHEQIRAMREELRPWDGN
jgi:acid phosphatase